MAGWDWKGRGQAGGRGSSKARGKGSGDPHAQRCPFHQHGTCRHGQRCRFSHDSDAPSRCDCPELCEAYPNGERGVHTLRSSDLAKGESLLGSFSNFCPAFFHLADTPEANLSQGCLREGPAQCRGKATVLVAVLAQQHNTENASGTEWRDVYIARYKNCPTGARCAEDALFADELLASAIRSHDTPQTLRTWQLITPCNAADELQPGVTCCNRVRHVAAQVS
jgi:hypothetical protein